MNIYIVIYQAYVFGNVGQPVFPTNSFFFLQKINFFYVLDRFDTLILKMVLKK
jgi:hypothetical protein